MCSLAILYSWKTVCKKMFYISINFISSFILAVIHSCEIVLKRTMEKSNGVLVTVPLPCDVTQWFIFYVVAIKTQSILPCKTSYHIIAEGEGEGELLPPEWGFFGTRFFQIRTAKSQAHTYTLDNSGTKCFYSMLVSAYLTLQRHVNLQFLQQTSIL